MASPFFVAGGTIQPDAGCYLERKADRELAESLAAGQVCYVLDSRQKGKSSVLARALGSLRARGFRTCLWDMQRFGLPAEPERWYSGLVAVLAKDFGVVSQANEYWRDNSGLAPCHRLFGFLRKVVTEASPSERFALLVDEVDLTRSLQFPCEEFFTAIREIATARSVDPALERLSFCLVGSAHPSELVRDIKLTPFNVGHRIELTDFSVDELLAWSGELGPDGGQAVRRIHFWTNGHPYLSQRIAAEHLANGGTIDDAVRRLFFEGRARDQETNLVDVRRRILETELAGHGAEESRVQILDLLERIIAGDSAKDVDESDPARAVLWLSGVLQQGPKGLRVRNRIYEKVFNKKWCRDNLPGAERRRQARAARRATARTIMVTGGLAAAFGYLAWTNSLVANQLKLALNRADAEAVKAEKESRSAQFEGWRAVHMRQAAQTSNEQLAGALGREKESRADAESSGRAAKEQAAIAQRNAAESQRQTQLANKSTAEARESNRLRILQLAPFLHDRRDFDRLTGIMGQIPQEKRNWEWSFWRAASSGFLRRLNKFGPLSAVAMSPDGEWFVYATEHGQVAVADSSKLEDSATLSTTERFPTSVAISPNGQIAIGYLGGKVLTFDSPSSKPRILRNAAELVRRLQYSRDGKQLAVGTEQGVIRVFDSNSGVQTWEYETKKGPVYAIDWNPLIKGGLIFGGSAGHVACIVPGEKEPRWVNERWEINVAVELIHDLRVSPKGDKVAVLRYGGWLKVLDVLSGSVRVEKMSPEGQHRTAWLDEDKFAIARTSNEISVFSIAAGDTVKNLLGHSRPAMDIAYDTTHGRLLSGSQDGTVAVWDPNQFQNQVDLRTEGPIAAISTSPDGRYVLLQQWDGLIYMYRQPDTERLMKKFDLNNSKASLRIEDVPCRAIPFSPDNKYWAASGTSGSTPVAVIYKNNQGNSQQLVRLSGHSAPITWLAFSPDSARLATASRDGTVRVWSVSPSTVKPLIVLNAGQPVMCAEFSHGGDRIATCGGPWNPLVAGTADPYAVKLWDAKTGGLQKSFIGHSAQTWTVQFDRADKNLYSAGWDRRIVKWNLANDRSDTVAADYERFTALDLSPDQTRILGAQGREMTMWETATGHQTLAIKNDMGQIWSARFSSDGNVVMCATQQGAILYYANPVVSK